MISHLNYLSAYFLCSTHGFHLSIPPPPPSLAQPSFRPKALVIPVTKDASTLQYVTQIHQRNPLVPINLVLDLGGQFLWVHCDQNYASSTYRPARCNSAQCSLADASGCGQCLSPPRPGCNNNSCGVTPDNTYPHRHRRRGRPRRRVLPIHQRIQPGSKRSRFPLHILMCAHFLIGRPGQRSITTFLVIDEEGVGGTKISTVNPLHSFGGVDLQGGD